MVRDLRDLGRSVGDADGNPLPELNAPDAITARGPGTIRDPGARGNRSLHGVFNPTIFLYDNYPGGIGFSEPLYALHARLVSQAKVLIESCPCHDGCPSCVGPQASLGMRSKAVALTILRGMLDEREQVLPPHTEEAW